MVILMIKLFINPVFFWKLYLVALQQVYSKLSRVKWKLFSNLVRMIIHSTDHCPCLQHFLFNTIQHIEKRSAHIHND